MAFLLNVSESTGYPYGGKKWNYTPTTPCIQKSILSSLKNLMWKEKQ